MLFKKGNRPGSAKIILQLAFIAAVCISLVSCKKAIEQRQRNIIIDAMTNGSWYVQQYKENTADITGDFSAYDFKFEEDGHVKGMVGTTVKSTGTWDADVSNYTISAKFPDADAGDTLRRLNYTWKITDSYLDYVEAKTSTASGDNILHLKKR